MALGGGCELSLHAVFTRHIMSCKLEKPSNTRMASPWIQNYVKSKGCQAIELNAYIDNKPSQHFYERDDYQRLGYHYVKQI